MPYIGWLIFWRYELKQTGTYTVQVQACSLAGCGEWSKGISVSVAQKSTAYLLYVILIPVLIVVLVITMLASGFIYVKYKASNAPEIKWTVSVQGGAERNTQIFFQQNRRCCLRCFSGSSRHGLRCGTLLGRWPGRRVLTLHVGREVQPTLRYSLQSPELFISACVTTPRCQSRM